MDILAINFVLNSQIHRVNLISDLFELVLEKENARKSSFCLSTSISKWKVKKIKCFAVLPSRRKKKKRVSMCMAKKRQNFTIEKISGFFVWKKMRNVAKSRGLSKTLTNIVIERNGRYIFISHEKEKRSYFLANRIHQRILCLALMLCDVETNEIHSRRILSSNVKN